jgi:hypothetical protein
MNREEFKRRWELDTNGDGITFDEIADCAQAWGLYARPRVQPMDLVRYKVLCAASTTDCEEYRPEEEA